jgi:Ser-tRNA(Ala) deacylase AlaX
MKPSSNNRIYQQPQPPLSGTVRVIALGVDPDGRAWVATDRFFAHPRGGGQQEDRGRLGAATLVSVVNDETYGVKHYVSSIEGMLVDGELDVEIDPLWRRLQARSHTAGHALDAVMRSLEPSLEPVAAHHWLREQRVEWRGSPTALSSLADRLRDAVHALSLRRAPVILGADALARRTVTIDSATTYCGGTHLDDCGPLDTLLIRNVKEKGGRVRVGYGFPDETA